MPKSQEHILGWPYLRQIKSDYHGWLSVMTSSEGLLFSLTLGPKPTTSLGGPRKNTHFVFLFDPSE